MLTSVHPTRVVTLNQLQRAFFNRVVTGSFDKLLLTGEAGTGKTFVLSMAVKALTDADLNVCVAAPTHLARLNLIARLPAEAVCKVTAITVASVLSKFGYDQGDGSTRFTEANGRHLAKYDVIIIDEVSMLGQKDFDVLKKSGTKMIFSGDFAQLPAVMAKSAMGDMLGTVVDHYHFTEQMRQVGVIHELAERNRHAVHFPTVSVTGDEGEKIVVHNTTDDLVSEMIGKMCDEITDIGQAVNYRYITYTNNDVSVTNQHIRNTIVARFISLAALTEHFVPGEPMMMYENINVAYNGEIVRVMRVETDPQYRYINPYPWQSYLLTISRPGSSVERVIHAIPPSQLPQYWAYFEDLQSQFHRARIREEWDQADELLTEIRYIKSHWTRINYPYAVTCHKSQGMSIPYVFLNTAGFAKAPGKRALLYVGISRAQRELHAVRVVDSDRQRVAKINAEYRAARAEYEALTGEGYAKVRRRTGLPTGTPEEKVIFTGYLQALILDLRQQVPC